MHEENHNDSENKKDIIDMAMTKARLYDENETQVNEINNNGFADHEQELVADSTINDTDVIERRKYPRSEFTYPADFKIFYQNMDHLSFNGYLKDLSISGACLQFEDRYGRFSIKDTKNVKIKISFSIPNEDKVNIIALIRWITKIDPKTFSIKMGIEFIELEDWQSDIINTLIGMRNKDHNMMWNLWEQYNNWR